jgi:hypothetical protein
MATIVSILLELKISPVIWWIASIFTVISGIDYARRGINALNNLDHGTPYEKPDSRPHP